MVAPAVLLVSSAQVQLLALVLGGLVSFCALTQPDQEPLVYKRLVVSLRRALVVVFLNFCPAATGGAALAFFLGRDAGSTAALDFCARGCLSLLVGMWYSSS